MKRYYTDERNVQIVVALLKEHGIRKVIASPGSANSPLVASLQYDSYFEMYSSVDERSAAYIACGLAEESGEPIVLSCTGATASRNYLPGLTEAYYRKLPILAITSTRIISKVGHLEDQVLDRSLMPKDVAKISVTLPIVGDDDSKWECETKMNQAILKLKQHGGGPVHINLPTDYKGTFNTKKLPDVQVIKYITANEEVPTIPEGKIAVFVGSHRTFTRELTAALDRFCASNDAIVLCDHTSGYKGKYRVLFPILMAQLHMNKTELLPVTLIHIGEVSASFSYFNKNPKQVWRVSEDGEIRDTFHKLRYVFEMTEQSFFNHYSQNSQNFSDNYLKQWYEQIENLYSQIPELPFSNVWIAKQLANQIPKNATIHFGILNSLNSWNYFELSHSVVSNSNVGGFGIDGCLSSLVGASLADRNKLYFGIIGDLAFFYDLNVIGNRHIRNNLRIILINNGMGVEFKIRGNQTAQFENETNEYIAAARHYGNKSRKLVKHYVSDLGFEYLSASNKEEFEKVYEEFVTTEVSNKSKVLEIFTNDEDEKIAHILMSQIETSRMGKTTEFAKNIIGEKGVKILKNIIR